MPTDVDRYQDLTPGLRRRGDVAFSRISRQTAHPLPITDHGRRGAPHHRYARDYMLALSKERERRADWQHACRPLMEEAGVAAVTR